MTALATRLDGPAPEAQVVRDMVRRGVIAAPLLMLFCLAIWGANGAITSAYGIVVVLANLVLAAALITTTARVSLGLLMGAALFGYVLRLGLIFLAYLAVHRLGWFVKGAFGLTIIVTHLGLLIVETRHISASLAYPGLKPTTRTRTSR